MQLPDAATARDVIDKLFFSDKHYDLGEVETLPDKP
jgi:DNA-directed RNA polymerase subunit beta